MEKKNNKSQVRLILIVILSIFILAGVFATYAFPGATGSNTVLKAQACNSENNFATPNNFSGNCSSNLLDFNDGLIQNMTNANANRYQGLNMTAYNSSITNCGTITSVKLCYEWWFTGGTSTLSNCIIKVDADGGASYTNATPSCPGTTANPGETCLDVTGLESWVCSDFFTASGIRAVANLEALFATANRPLTVDSFYFNVTYTSDDVLPTINIVYPTNTTYTGLPLMLNSSISDTNLASCWWTNNSGITNHTFTCGNNITLGNNVSIGNNRLTVWANDSYGNRNSSSVTFNVNPSPNINNITVVPSPAGLSSQLIVRANGVNDTNNDSLNFYCSESSLTPTDNNLCSGGGNLTGITNPYNPTCLYYHNRQAGNYTVYCRLYDGNSYSSTVNKTYTVAGDSLTTSVISVAGDTDASYYDDVNDGKTEILVLGNSNMSCKWSSSDLAYSSMSSTCASLASGLQANCSINDVSSEGFDTRYIACQDSYGNSQTATTNLNVNFYLDYSAPTTYDNSDSNIHVPTYLVTIVEADNVDGDPVTYYCSSSTPGCSPITAINDLGNVVYTSFERGTNYLRYNSVDFVGNTQEVVNKTVLINQLPIFVSATDNAGTILGGTTVTISTVDSDPDASQNIKLFVCNSSAANSSGCLSGTYCSALGSSNLSCGFASESDSALHTWYAYVYDSLGESATSNNPLTGTFITDSTGPSITIYSPENTTYYTTAASITLNVIVSETSASVWYNLDNNLTYNGSLSNISSLNWMSTISSLSEGSHSIIFYANDSYGNNGNSTRLYFSVITPPDTIPPVITIVSPLNLSYNNASSILINLTTNEALSWAGYSFNGGSVSSLTQSALTNWYSLVSATDESTHLLTVFANDTGSNQANKSITIYADSRAPRYSNVSARPSPANQSQNVNCSIVWNDKFNISSVIIGEDSLGSYENHTISVSGNYSSSSYLISGTKLSTKGTYHCTFYATDIAGNTNSTSVTFSVNDVTAPVLTVTSPSNATYNQNSVSLSVLTDENVSSVWYYNGTSNVSMSNSSTTAWSATLTNLVNGQYNVKFYANDTSGNVGNSSTTYFTVNAIADTVPPVITMINPINLSYKSPEIRLNISSNEALIWAGYTLNGGNLTALGNTSTTSWNISLPELTQESTNTLVIYANDTSNNRANLTIIFYVDTLAPRYSNVSSRPSPANQSQNVNCSIVWNDKFNISSVIIGEDSLGSYENHTISVSGNYSSSSYLISGTKLSTKGTYHCTFYATDAAGNTNSTSTTFSVNDVTAPVLTVTSPTSGGTYNQQNVTVSIIANENITSAWYYNGTANISMSNTSTAAWNATLVNLANGSYTIRFYANDTSGNLGSSSTISFSVDTGLTDTIPPVITISTIANASYKGLTASLNITTNEVSDRAFYSLNGAANVSMSNSSTTAWNATLTLSQESTNTLVVYANDTSRNLGSSTITFYADTKSPGYSSVSATPSPANESQSVVCNIYFNDTFGFSSVKIAENSTISGVMLNHTIDLSSRGYANYTILNVAKGTYSCIFYATDVAGNTNSTSVTFSVNDVTAPVLTVTSPSNATYNQNSVSLSVLTNENVSSVWYYNGTANVSMINSSTTAWSATLTNLVNGQYNVKFYANDTSGNVGNSSTTYFTVNAIADTVPPVITISTIANASYKELTVGLNITTNEVSDRAFYSLNGAANVSMSNSSTTAWNATLTLSQESTNTLVVYANDTSGNLGSSTITFYADTLAPRYSSATASPSPANESQSVVCNIYFNDTFGFSSVKIAENSTISGVMLNHTIDLSSRGYANYTILNVAKGTYSCIFYATDVAGNTNSTSITFSVNDVTAPVLTVNSPQNTTYSTTSILFSLTTNENSSFANYSLDGAANVSLTGSGTSWSKTQTLATGNHNVIFYAGDSSGNIGTSTQISFSIDTTVYDTTEPIITVWSPINGSYSTIADTLLNITGNKNLSWAGYKLDSGSLTNLDNVSLTNWNTTLSLTAGQHNITFYVNDTTSNRNQGNKTIVIYTDLSNPQIVSFSCTNPVNDSKNVNCSASVSDTLGLNYAIVGYNATGTWVNSSQIDLTGLSSLFSYSIDSANTTPGTFMTELYLYDSSGRFNSSSYLVSVSDDRAPEIYNITYSPNTTDALDPGVLINVNATIYENYNLSSVVLMYKKLGDASWSSIAMNNNSYINLSGAMNILYNASFVPANGTYTFKINATDSARNQNISTNTSLIVQNDTSFWNNLAIADIKSFTDSQRSENNTLGFLYINNTGDDVLIFNVSVISSLGSRFDINYTHTGNASYTLASGENLSLLFLVNTTGLSGLYPYNISLISDSGTTIFEKNVNLQSIQAPYLVTSITKYSSSVTGGQTDIELIASVSNFGTDEAQNVFLNWSLPNVFTLVSGNLSRNLGNMPIGSSFSNSIVVSVASSAVDSIVNITAEAFALGNLSSSDFREVTVSTLIESSPSSGSGTGGSGGGAVGSKKVVYSRDIEVTRGSVVAFNINVENKYLNKTLEDLTLQLTGFPEQYITISPSIIKKLNYGQKDKFVVQIKLPTYSAYEEEILKAMISGKIVSEKDINDYEETQNIKLIIQEISHDQALAELELARKAVEDMKLKNMPTISVEKLLIQADDLINKNNQHKSSFDVSSEIIQIKENAFEADDLLRRIIAAMADPKMSNLVVGNAVRNIGSYDTTTPLMDLITGKVVFTSISIEDLVNLGVAAFERGDYESALARAKEARDLLILERKGNFLLFLYLYWPFIILGIFLVSGAGMMGYRSFQKSRISKRIQDLGKKEDSVRKVMVESQNKYFVGKESPTEYRKNMAQTHGEIAKIKKERETLANTRVRILQPEELSKDLEKERKEVEKQIIDAQEKYYREKKIPESEYKEEFGAFNERLAEIEDEKTTLDLLDKRANKKPGFFDRIKQRLENRRTRKDEDIKIKIDKMLKSKKGDSLFI